MPNNCALWRLSGPTCPWLMSKACLPGWAWNSWPKPPLPSQDAMPATGKRPRKSVSWWAAVATSAIAVIFLWTRTWRYRSAKACAGTMASAYLTRLLPAQVRSPRSPPVPLSIFSSRRTPKLLSSPLAVKDLLREIYESEYLGDRLQPRHWQGYSPGACYQGLHPGFALPPAARTSRRSGRADSGDGQQCAHFAV